MTLNYVYLLIAVAFEVTATMALKSTNGFTRLWPSLISIAGYALAAYFLSLLVRTIPVGIVYALWCGLGIFFLVAIAWIFYRQALDLPALLGLGLIVARRNHQPILEKHPALSALPRVPSLGATTKAAADRLRHDNAAAIYLQPYSVLRRRSPVQPIAAFKIR